MFERIVSYPAAYTHKKASRDPEILLALEWLLAQGETTGGEILVLAPGLDNLDNSSVITACRGSLLCMSEATFKKRRYEWKGGPVLALWPTAPMMALIDDHLGTKAVAAIPWLLQDIEPWARSRRPVDLLGMAPLWAEPDISDPVVRIALKHLTATVNLGTGLLHPSDKAHAVETFKILRRGRHWWTADEIHAWALTHGWTNDGADDLRKYAAGILDGRNFRTTKYGLNPMALEHWRQEAAAESL